MEIIIHGKPNAGCSKSTSSFDSSLSERIVDDFFTRWEDVKDKEALIVDARNWKGVWYSVYTYKLTGLREKSENAGRSTYFAISLIFKGAYCCLVSEVFSLLKNVCRQSVVGTYISSQGQYLAPNFEDSAAFEKVVKTVNDKYVNLEEEFDSKFKPCLDFSNENRYSILDCDSKAFIQTLREVGRVIVTETELSKDDQLANVAKADSLYKQAQAELSVKDSKIEELNKKVKEWENSFSQSTASSSEKMEKFKREIKGLVADKEKLQAENENLSALYNGTKTTLGKIAGLLGGIQSSGESAQKPQPSPVKPLKVFLAWLPLLNTLLLIIMIALMFLHLKGFTEPSPGPNPNVNVSQEEYNALKDDFNALQEKHQALQMNYDVLKESKDEVKAESPEISTAPGLDLDCGVQIFQGNKPVKPDEVDRSKPITIIVQRPHGGYAFHVSGFADGPTVIQQLNNKEAIALPQTGQVVITYRTDESTTRRNPANCFTFKKK